MQNRRPSTCKTPAKVRGPGAWAGRQMATGEREKQEEEAEIRVGSSSRPAWGHSPAGWRASWPTCSLARLQAAAAAAAAEQLLLMMRHHHARSLGPDFAPPARPLASQPASTPTKLGRRAPISLALLQSGRGRPIGRLAGGRAARLALRPLVRLAACEEPTLTGHCWPSRAAGKQSSS